jgi:Fur family peroxide stress response transcriptional regulator
MDLEGLRKILSEKGLKVTPQRLAVLGSIREMKNHPTVEMIFEEIRQSYPNIAMGTVYNILETFVRHGIVNKVNTDEDAMHYDGITSMHHHLYSPETGKIEDYIDEQLNKMLTDYFKQKKITDFEIDKITLQIKGKFLNN